MNKTHLIGTIKLLVLILILSWIIDKAAYYTITKISDNVFSGQAIGKLNQYLAIKDTTKTIVFGSSRANHHIDIRKLTRSSYNIGIDGKFIAHNAILIKMLPTDKKQNVILHIDPNIAFRQSYNSDAIISLNTKYHTNDIIKKELIRAEKNITFQNYYWCIDYNGAVLGILKNALFPNYNPDGYYGFDPMPISQADIEIFEKILARNIPVSTCNEDVKINDIFLEYLLEVIAFCKTNNKNLIIITSPIYEDNCPEDNAILAALLEKHNIKYYDYTNYFKGKNNIKYWKDYAHMSDIGANLFSKTLSEEIELNEY